MEGRSGPLGNFYTFSKFDTFGMYYGARKIFIADVMCTMKTSLLPSFVSLGNQGDPTVPIIRKGPLKVFQRYLPVNHFSCSLGYIITKIIKMNYLLV